MKHWIFHRRLRAWLACAALVAASAAAGAPPITSVPPAPNRAPMLAKAAASLQLVGSSAARVIALPAPSAIELATLNTLPLPARAKPQAVGIGRDVAAGAIDLSTLPWQTGLDGSRAVQVRVQSIGAAGLRVALRMPRTDPDVMVRIAGSGAQDVHGPYPANTIAEATASRGEWWSPVLSGDTAIVEVSVPAGASTAGISLSVVRLSHLVRAGAALNSGPAAKASGPGTSGACETNWKCIAPQTTALAHSASAVARMLFTHPSGNSYLCTGTLVNDSTASSTPYFFTATHCIDDAYTAQTLNVFWFFDAPASECGPTTSVVNYVQQSSGATLLGLSHGDDWALLRLNATPPGGTWFSAWNATPTISGALIDLHHPSGDTKKHSAGELIAGPDGGYFHFVTTSDETGLPEIDGLLAVAQWSQGVTEGGSSGSGLLTYLASGGYYELRGGLSGGSSDCSDPTGTDLFTRFDKMLPLVRDYLVPGSMPATLAVVVEYYNASLDHYFMTMSPIEINDLDTGVFTGWVRTGLRFLAYTRAVSGASPVCRFYRTPGYGDSHFYSASPAECATLVDNPRFPGWTFESSNVFYIVQPNQDSGACPANTHPLWRFFHAAVTNHRYTADISVRNTLRDDPAWIPEGYGPDAVIMCSPNGS